MEVVNISEQLKGLIEEYCFNMETLSKYLKLDIDKIELLKNGDTSFLPDDNKYTSDLLKKISFLYFSSKGDKNFKLNAFLDVLISYHNISKKTISKISGVEINKIDKFLSSNDNNISVEDKYKLAETTMSLRFLLKDIEE